MVSSTKEATSITDKDVKKTKPRKSLCLQLDDEDSAMFVPIKSTPKNKRVLTEHQRDLLTSRKDDIPALYSELSRDDSLVMLPSQFISQDSLDASSKQASKDASKELTEEESNSQSLLKSMKSRKNQRVEIPENLRTLRRGRSVDKANDSSDSQKDLFADGSSINDDFKKPDNSEIDSAVTVKESDKSLDSSQSSVCDSVSSVDDIIESSQDATMEAKMTPRRSRRKTLEKVKNELEANTATSSPSIESVDEKRNKWGETNLYVAVKKGQK